MTGRPSLIRERFGRQARAFSRSPPQRDPERLSGLLALLDSRPGERVLDVACGPGIVTAELARVRVIAFGVDLTEAMLHEAERIDGSHYVVGDAGELPFRDGTFDRALARNAFHHLPDPLSVARQMKRTVRRGGAVVVEDRSELLLLLGGSGLVVDQERLIHLTIDSDEWVDCANPAPAARDRARSMVEACIEADHCGHEVWRETGRLKFRRWSMIVRALRPA